MSTNQKSMSPETAIELWEVFRLMIRDQNALWSAKNLIELVRYMHEMPKLLKDLETDLHNKRDLQCSDPIRMDRYRCQYILNVQRGGGNA